MTGPIKFNPFQGVGGTQNLEQIQDRRKSLRFPDIDLSPVELNMSQGQDEEGLYIMRQLGRNMAFFLQCIKLGHENGLKVDESEPKVKTNFIR